MALAFNKSGDCILINEEEVQIPTIAAGGRIRYGHFAADEEPTAWIIGIGINLVPWKKLRVCFKQVLEVYFLIHC